MSLTDAAPRDVRVARPGTLQQTSSGAVAEAQLHLRLLGGFELTVDGDRWELPPAAERLVAYLALQARPLVRSHVAGVLWGERTDDRAGACLRSAIWRANGGGARSARGRVVHATRSTVGLHAATVDARDAAGAAHDLLVGGDPVAPAILDGDLLPGWYDDWVVVERERLSQLCLEGLEQMAQDLLAGRLWHRAVEAALAVLAVEPLREQAHRILVEAHLGAGNRAAAVRQLERCRVLLERELGLPPGPALLAAAARLAAARS